MNNQDSKNFVDSILDAQKQAVDTVVENTKKLTNGNAMVNDTVQKGTEWYKNWLEEQKNIFSKTTGKATEATENVKENASKMNDFYQNWFNMQAEATKQAWEMNMNWMKGLPNNNTNSTDMFANWTNWMNNMNQGANWMNNMNQWQNQAQNMNPFNMDSWKKANENITGIFNQYYEMLNGNMADWQKNFKNGTVQDAYHNMVNTAEGFTRFYEMWSPMWKSIQEKTFNADVYKQFANPAMYKDLMDKYFGFVPENTRQHVQNMTDMMNGNMKQFGQAAMNNFMQMRGMATGMPGMNMNETFGNMLNGYNQMYSTLNNAFAPLTKMMPANQHTKTMTEWNDIFNRAMVYNIKNSELQYMMYNQGTKVMDKLAENVAAKIEKGEEVNSIMALYQEWLNISDKVFVSLFESDEYGKLMAEVSAMQLTLRKDMERQTEKMMTGIPVATRSEMDELYKTIYDLKKQVRELQKAVEYSEMEEEPVKEKATAKTAAGSKKK